MKGMDSQILRLALPSILANVTVPLVGMVDLAVAGHLTGGAAAFIGAISIGSMFFDLLYWNFSFLRAGTGGLTAQAYGRQDWGECARNFIRGTLIALAISLLVLAIQWPFIHLGLRLVNGSAEVKELAQKYFLLRVWAAPATVSLMSFRGWFVGMQDTVSSMFTDLVVNISNIVGSIILSLGVGRWQGMGFSGIAAGTVVAQYLGLMYAAGTVLFKYRHIFEGFTRKDVLESFRSSDIKGLFSMNVDLLLRSLALTAVYIGFTVISAGYGDLMLAASSVLMKLLMIFSFFTDGFAYAAQALCGKFIGARDPGSTREAVRRVFVWSMGIGLSFIFIYWGLGTPMVRALTSDESVVQACRLFLPWLLLMPPVGCAAFTWDGIYEGATATRSMRDATIASFAGFLGVWWLLRATLLAGRFPAGAGNEAISDAANLVQSGPVTAIHCLMAAYFVHLAIRTVWLWITCRRDIFRRPFGE